MSVLKVKKLSVDAVLPKKAKEGDAGYDVVAIDDGKKSSDGLYIEYDTGIAIEPPEGYHVELFPRSSVSNYDLSLANSVGVVDQGYRGPLKYRFKITNRFSDQPGLVNKESKLYKKGDKIGQILIRKTINFDIKEVETLSDTERGTGGFGSSDKK